MESLPTEMFHIVGAYFDIHVFLGICKLYKVKPLFSNFLGMNKTEILFDTFYSIREHDDKFIDLAKCLCEKKETEMVEDMLDWSYYEGYLDIIECIESHGYIYEDVYDNRSMYQYIDIVIHLFVNDRLPSLNLLFDQIVSDVTGCYITNIKSLKFLHKIGATCSD